MKNLPADTSKAPGAAAVPVWLLDVDGVVNAPRIRGFGSAPHHGIGHAFGQSWKLRWAPAVVDAIRDWHLKGRVEVRWATTWCPYADQLESLWGLPPLERALTGAEASTRENATTAKVRAAIRVVETECRQLVWTEDELPTDEVILRRLQPASASRHSLLIAPDPRRGLTREDIHEIDRFLAGHSA